jgi:hypothetical protein
MFSVKANPAAESPPSTRPSTTPSNSCRCHHRNRSRKVAFAASSTTGATNTPTELCASSDPMVALSVPRAHELISTPISAAIVAPHANAWRR